MYNELRMLSFGVLSCWWVSAEAGWGRGMCLPLWVWARMVELPSSCPRPETVQRSRGRLYSRLFSWVNIVGVASLG